MEKHREAETAEAEPREVSKHEFSVAAYQVRLEMAAILAAPVLPPRIGWT